MFTPASKAAVGEHDENISFDEVVKLRRRRSRGAACATRRCGSTKFAAVHAAGARHHRRGHQVRVRRRRPRAELHLIDEVLTPDSSRFWPADTYQVGISPPSFDKQFVRDYLETLDWNKKAPGPEAARRSHPADRAEICRSPAPPHGAGGGLIPR
jgi:phosphoribosylaminoimidazole-succinocarboxamide synthase